MVGSKGGIINDKQRKKRFLHIRSATKEESAIYEKIENILNHSMTKTESNLFYDLIDMEELSHLLRNKIKNKCLQELLNKYNITAEEVCTWFFIEEE